MAPFLKPLTELAQIYSHPRSKKPKSQTISPLPSAPEPFNILHSHAAIAKYVPLKSGLTPIALAPLDTAAERIYALKIEAYQRKRFRGFSIQQLHLMGAFAPLRDGDTERVLDAVPIHKLFEKQKWELPLPKHCARMPLGNGRIGYWETQNSAVWKAMQPALKLASQFLYSASTWPWWDALFAGEYVKVPKDELDDKDKHKICEIFYPRPPHIANIPEHQKAVQERFLSACDKVDFGLISGSFNSDTGVVDSEVFVLGVCKSAAKRGLRNTTVWLSIEELEPLLNPNITVAERMLSYFMIANTLLHETTHALWYIIRDQHKCGIIDPYFQDEPLSEIGLSYENAVFGGLPRELVGSSDLPAKGLPVGGILQSAFSCAANAGLVAPEDPILKNKRPLDWDSETYFPITLDYFFSLQDPVFWKVYVKAYGAESTHMGPKTVGSKLQPGERDMALELWDKSPPAVYDTDDMTLDVRTMSQEEIDLTQIENKRKAMASRVVQALNEYTDQRTVIFEQYAQMPWMSSASDSGDEGDETEDNEPNPLCPRWQEIRQYLIENYNELAFGTMHFKMGEHVLFANIQANGGISLRPDEWRAFLLLCQRINQLFRWEAVGSGPAPAYGVIEKILRGWPKIAYPATVLPPLDERQRHLFERGTARVVNKWKEFAEDDQWDFDQEIFRDLTNLANENIKGPIAVLSVADFDLCISHYERDGDKWAHGPKGIIRKLKLGPKPIGPANGTSSTKISKVPKGSEKASSISRLSRIMRGVKRPADEEMGGQAKK